MMDNIKTIEQILKEKGITEKTKFHVYEYLYKSFIQACKDYKDQFNTDK